jgi:ubiquinone/menaquinone biosynthesis C-methylase UbiE
LHSAPAPGDVFGRAAEDYELGRADWPESLVERALRELELGPDAEVLDLAAGTGKLTRVLVPRVRRVVAVEPDGEMRSLLARLVPGAEALAGHAERIPLPDGSVDGVFVGEAFHWFEGPAALAEIARVLRPRGGLALLWNEGVKPIEPPVGEEADRVADEAIQRGGAPGGPRYRSGAWKEAFATAPFDELREEHLEYETGIDRDALVAYVLSISSVASLSAEERAAVGARLRELVEPREYRRFQRADLYWTRLAAGR